MENDHQIELIFAPDEMVLQKVRANISRDELLRTDGVFFLKDIAAILEIDSAVIKKRARAMVEAGKSPWRVMGARKIWNHWIIRMKVFSPYYRRRLISHVRAIPPEWNGNILLGQHGIFYLTDVCRLIPFTPQQLRYQAKRNPDARTELGIWKDVELGAYLVDMGIFGPWINRVWEDGNAT